MLKTHPARIRSFREFWPWYVGEHKNPLCRLIHYLAGVLALGLVLAGLLRLSPLLLLLAPVVAYGLAWLAHFFVERNRPATWRYVRWSLLAEFKMLGLGLQGRMGAEVERHFPRVETGEAHSVRPPGAAAGR